jgi:hypothetical protein
VGFGPPYVADEAEKPEHRIPHTRNPVIVKDVRVRSIFRLPTGRTRQIHEHGRGDPVSPFMLDAAPWDVFYAEGYLPAAKSPEKASHASPMAANDK